MKKNRLKEENQNPVAGQSQQKSPAEHILVFLVLALILLAANVLINHPFLSLDSSSPVSTDTPENYIWVTGSSKHPAGLYRVAPEDLESEFPGSGKLFAGQADNNGVSRVAAIHYKDDIPQQTNLPPQVANIFFQPISINRADKEVLTSLPGIGAVLAEKIVQRRSQHGPFRSKDELLQINGIGPKKYAGLVDRITLN